jgi:cation diffusion facilitator CzcD-associated flavoprotein CzcO
MTQPADTATQNGSVHPKEYDAVIVGTGFGGVYLLRNLRKLGYNVKAFESGDGLGGVWWWNSYPGARVDTSCPFYEFSDEKVWEDWNWKEFFPGRDELCEYFKHVDKKWDLSKDIQYQTTVTAADFDLDQDKWTVHTDKGDVVKTQFLLIAAGFAAKIYVPQMKGLDTFEGTAYHTALWPKDGVDCKNKRVGVIGTGASGVQVIQELGPVAKQLTVFQRTPNLALPMCQQTLGPKENVQRKKGYADLHKIKKTTYAGWDYNPGTKKGLEDSPEERKAFWEALWAKGGFNPWLGNYADLMNNEDVNTLFYNFWKDKVRSRLTKDDPELIENLAPERPIHPFGTKRPSLEQQYYEVYNQDNVELVNLKKDPIVEITPTGVRTANKEYDLDVLVLGTGFDSVTGSLTRIDLRGTDGVTLKEYWKNGSCTQMGIAVAGFPNMFFLYGPQSPCAFAIGPCISEVQGDWIVAVLEKMKGHKQTRIEADRDAAETWSKHTNELGNASLLVKNDSSWYMGANIPGKPRECLNYLGGIPTYSKALNDSIDNGFAGFHVK